MEKVYIYTIKSNEKIIYVGSTIDFERRKSQHLAKNSSVSEDMYKHFDEVGIENIKIDIVCETNEKERLKVEEEFQRLYDTVENGFNKCYATSNSVEHISRLKKIYKGKGNPMYGKTHSEEYKAKLKERMKGNTIAFGNKNACKKVLMIQNGVETIFNSRKDVVEYFANNNASEIIVDNLLKTDEEYKPRLKRHQGLKGITLKYMEDK